MRSVGKKTLSIILSLMMVLGVIVCGFGSITVSATVYASDIVSYARQFLGCSYVSGGKGPDKFDCSGFVYYVFNHFGISLTSSAKNYYNSPTTYGTVVSESDLKPGDVIAWHYGGTNYHVVIYSRNGNCINAANKKDGVCEKPYHYYNKYNGNTYSGKCIRIKGVDYGTPTTPTVTTPPTWATLTADKTSLPLGGSITFTMNSDTATYYNITILRSINSGTATEQSLQKLYHYSNTYTFTPTKEGKYTVFISAYNEIEPHADGNAVNFTVYGHPTWATLTADKTSLPLGESVTLTMRSDTATYYNITILRSINSGTATEQSLQKLYHYSNTYTFTPTIEGKYTAFISAYNEIEPHADGNAVNFTVYDTSTQYTISYNANGGTGTPASQTGNGSITLSSAKPTRSNYTFLGWATTASATAAQYQPGASYNLTANTTLYAVWKQNPTPTTYTLTYNANGGSVSPTSVNVTAGGSATLPTPTRSGYTFTGWNTKSDGSGTSYKAGASYKPTANTTLYAQWKKIVATTYTLTYNANGGSGAPAKQTGNGNVTISGTSPYRSGYLFLGWTTVKTSTVVNYKPGDTVKLTGDLTLYAVWQKNPTPTVAIRNFVAERYIDYRSTITFHAVTANMTDGYTIRWLYNGRDSGVTSEAVKVTEAKENFTIQAIIVDSSGKTVARSGEETVYVYSGLFDRIIAFFISIFGTLPFIDQ